MALQNFPDNAIYELDNLDVLRGMNSETVDLIATDPPFNTKRNRSGSAGFYVDNWKWGDTGKLPDQWAWNEVHPIWLEEIRDDNPALYEVIEATEHCHGKDIAAFLCFLSVRLLEMHRVLKLTGSLYLHCDHTANAYIRMAMDAIFGARNFRNEIVWAYGGRGAKGIAKQFPRNHDTIFYYVKSNATYNKQHIQRVMPIEEARKRGIKTDEIGRYFKTAPRGDYTDISIQKLRGEGRIYETKNGTMSALRRQNTRDGHLTKPTGTPRGHDGHPIQLREARAQCREALERHRGGQPMQLGMMM